MEKVAIPEISNIWTIASNWTSNQSYGTAFAILSVGALAALILSNTVSNL